jgi:hypothetical protein
VDNLRYGLLRSEDVSSKGGRSNAAFPDHLNLSPAYAKARADATIAAKAREAAAWEAFEEQRLSHETDCAAFYIARGPFKFSGSISWTLRTDDPTRAETLTLHPLPSRSIRGLLRAGIIDTVGVIDEAWRKACEELKL